MDTEQTYLRDADAIPQAFARAWNAGDAVALASLFEEQAEFVNVVGLWWHDRAAIWKAHDYGLRVIFPGSTLRVGHVRCKLLGEEVAVVQARLRLMGQVGRSAEETPGVRRNLMTFVMHKRARGWVCVAAHNTDIVRGAETLIADAQGHTRPADYRGVEPDRRDER